MRTILLTAPDHEAMRTLGGDNPVVLRGQVRPDDQTDEDLAKTVLGWLGKDPFRSRSRLPVPGELHSWVHAWLRGSLVSTVIITDAQLMNDRSLAGMLEVLAVVETVILVQGPRAAGCPWPGRPIEEGTWSEWLDRLHPPTEQTPLKPAAAPLTPADLPACHFLTFRSQARKVLDKKQAARVDKIYVTAFKAAEPACPTNTTLMRTFLDVTIARLAANAAEALVILNATQAAMFSRGWLMQVDPDILWQDAPALDPHPSDDVWRRVNWIYDPQAAAILTLFLLHFAEDVITAFTIGDIRDAVSSRRLAHVDLPPQALRNLSAHLYELRGQEEEKPFVTQKPLRSVRTSARRNLGLAISGSRRASARRVTGPSAHLSIQLLRIGA